MLIFQCNRIFIYLADDWRIHVWCYYKPLAPYYDRNCINIPVHSRLCYCKSKLSLLFSVYGTVTLEISVQNQAALSRVQLVGLVWKRFSTRNEDILGYSWGEVWLKSILTWWCILQSLHAPSYQLYYIKPYNIIILWCIPPVACL